MMLWLVLTIIVTVGMLALNALLERVGDEPWTDIDVFEGTVDLEPGLWYGSVSGRWRK